MLCSSVNAFFLSTTGISFSGAQLGMHVILDLSTFSFKRT